MMSVNLGHPAGHAHFFQVSIILSEGREDIGIISYNECFLTRSSRKKRLKGFDCACPGYQTTQQDGYDRE